MRSKVAPQAPIQDVPLPIGPRWSKFPFETFIKKPVDPPRQSRNREWPKLSQRGLIAIGKNRMQADLCKSIHGLASPTGSLVDFRKDPAGQTITARVARRIIGRIMNRGGFRLQAHTNILNRGNGLRRVIFNLRSPYFQLTNALAWPFGGASRQAWWRRRSTKQGRCSSRIAPWPLPDRQACPPVPELFALSSWGALSGCCRAR